MRTMQYSLMQTDVAYREVESTASTLKEKHALNAKASVLCVQHILPTYRAEPRRKKAFTLRGSSRSTYPQSASASATLFSFKCANALLL